MESKAVGNGRNPYYEGQFDAEEPADTAARLALVTERDALRAALSELVTLYDVGNEYAAPIAEANDRDTEQQEVAAWDAARKALLGKA